MNFKEIKLKERTYLIVYDSGFSKEPVVLVIGQNYYYLSDEELTLEEIEAIDLKKYVWKQAKEVLA